MVGEPVELLAVVGLDLGPAAEDVLHLGHHPVPVHVGRDVVELLLETELALARVEHDVPDVADEDGEDEDADEPRGRHEEQLQLVVGRRLLVLADGRRRLGGEVEAVQVGCALGPIIVPFDSCFSFRIEILPAM